MNKKILLFLLFFPFCTVFSQNRIGTWRSHLPYSNASRLILADTKIYCVTDGGLFYYDQSDKSIEKFSKENGLSDTEISALAYADESKTTIIAYTNANIDLIQNNTIFNIPDILRYSQILGDKRINSIMIRKNLAYFSTGFGIVVLNLETREITETYKIGEAGAQIKVNEMCFDGQYLYAASDQGIYKADINAPNLQDYTYWNRITAIPDFDKKFNAISFVNGIVYVSAKNGTSTGDAIYMYNGSVWSTFSQFQNDDCNFMSEWNGNLVVSSRYHVHFYSPSGEEIKLLFTGSPKCAYTDKNSVTWVADADMGLLQNPEGNTKNIINPNGPSTIFVSDLAISENILYAVPGGLNSSSNNQFRNGEVNIYKENEWTGFKRTQYKDFYRIAIDPANPEHYFVGSWGYGLFEFLNDSLLTVYRDENSTLQTVIPGDFFRLGGLAYDAEGNLWVSNASVAEPISVRKKNGDWISFGLNNLVNSPFTGDIIVTRQGHKWMLLTPGRGLFAMDDNGTIDNPDDDRYIRFDVKDEFNAIITNDVYSIAEDKDGNIWLGTNKGVLVYYNPAGVFEGDNFYAQHINVPRIDDPGAGDYLLFTESVSAIAIDGANRKWLGTKNAGVSLVSDDGLKQIHNFSAENSPLLSNSISSIAINEKNGEVYFGTDKGIISYVADATGPAEDFSAVYVFPNPVRENYTGDIAIAGLVENSLVKITDLNGNLVFETVSLGGQALWDGNNFRGERARTGVYLVFCSNEDGSLSRVTKLLFIH